MVLCRNCESMDKFIIRRPRSPKEERNEIKREPKKKQTTIKSLARVVVVEDILHLKTSLEDHRKDLSPEKLIEILEKLKLMKPSKEVLKYTKIGRAVNSLRRSTSQPVRELSKLIVKNWKKLVEEETTIKEVIDVRCDAKTELLRSKGRKLIAAALDVNLPDEWTKTIERQLFYQCQRRVDNRYKRSMRSLVFFIKSDSVTKENAKHGNVSPDQVLSKCLFPNK